MGRSIIYGGSIQPQLHLSPLILKALLGLQREVTLPPAIIQALIHTDHWTLSPIARAMTSCWILFFPGVTKTQHWLCTYTQNPCPKLPVPCTFLFLHCPLPTSDLWLSPSLSFSRVFCCGCSASCLSFRLASFILQYVVGIFTVLWFLLSNEWHPIAQLIAEFYPPTKHTARPCCVASHSFPKP